MGTGTKIIILVLVLIIAIGFAIPIYQLNELRNKITVESIELRKINPKGDIFGIPTTVELSFDVNINNPTSYTLDIERITYTIYLQNIKIHEGAKHDITIPANSRTPISFEIEIDIAEAVSTIVDMMKHGVIECRITGIIDVPIKLFGVIKFFSFSIPYDKVSSLSLTSPITFTPVVVIDAGWNPTVIPLGRTTTAYVVLKSSEAVSGVVKLVIKKDLVLQPDQEVASEEFYISLHGEKSIEVQFTPTEPTSISLRGYHIEVYFNDEKIYSMPDSYPPRLKVLGFSLKYLNTRFEGNGKSGSIISVPIGTIVEVYVEIDIETPVSGTLSAEICKDYRLAPDVIFTTLTKSIELAEGQHWVYLGSFIADEKTNGFRQYFIRVLWENQLIFDPTDPDTRPHVTTFAPSVVTETYQHTITQTTTYEGKVTGELIFSDVKFVGAGKEGQIISVPVGTTVDIYVAVSVLKAPVEGMLTIEVRKDVVWKTDQLVVMLTKTVSLTTGTHWVHIGNFIASDKTGNLPGNTRQYFIKVRWNGLLIFDSAEPNTRPHVTTY
jgi:LEA14-like dessication related protein